MKSLLATISLLLLIFCSVNSQEKKVFADDYLIKTGEQAPDFLIREAGGQSYKLSSLKGKVVMLQFTASWCSVCRTEMPFIEKDIWLKLKKSDFALIGIDRDEPEDKVTGFHKEMKITYPLALDPGADIFGLYALKTAGVTRNVIIDRSGKIIFLTRLYKPEEFEAMKKVIFSEVYPKK
jgi:peroxiredoxin